MPHSQADLERAGYLVIEGEKRVSKQRLVIEQLAHDGHPTAEAQELLQNMLDLLDEMHAQLEEIASDVREEH